MTCTTHSHLTVLRELIERHNIKTVFEWGMGDGSTTLFIEMCERVVSVEMNHAEWFKKITHKWKSPPHWTPILSIGKTPKWDGSERFDLVFCDGHGDSRPEQIFEGMKMSDLVVVHDTEAGSYGWGRIKNHLPEGWTWEDDKRVSPWTSIIRRRVEVSE